MGSTIPELSHQLLMGHGILWVTVGDVDSAEMAFPLNDLILTMNGVASRALAFSISLRTRK
jgi:hypothetical protein